MGKCFYKFLEEIMKALKKIFFILTFIIIPLYIYSAPNYVNYQGRLIDSIGNPLSGNYNITFKLYDAASGGNLLWSETQNVNSDNGIFNAVLGSVSSLPSNVFSNDSLYLEIQIGAETLSPRTRLYSSPYARYAAHLGSASEQVTVSTDIILSSQLRLGNFSSEPYPSGKGALIYDTNSSQLKYYNGSGWIALSAGGVSPWSGGGTGSVILVTSSDKVGVGKSPSEKLDVAGNIKANYGIISTTGSVSNALYVGSGANISTITGNGFYGVFYGDGSNLSGISSADKVLKTGDTMTGTLVMNTPSAFNTTNQSAIVFSTNVYISNSQFRLGNISGTPSTVLGTGSIYYNTADNLLYYYNGSSWIQLSAGGPSPWSGGGTGSVVLVTSSDKVGVGKSPTEKLDVAGNIKADYGIISATGSISSALYIGSGANISTITPTGFYGDGSGLLNISSIAVNAVYSDAIADSAVTDAKIAGNISQSKVTNLVSDLASKAADSSVVHLSGAETIAGVKTFSADPVFNANAIPDAAIAGLSSSKLSGALPALDGSALVKISSIAVNAVYSDAIADSAVTGAKIATLTGTLTFGNGSSIAADTNQPGVSISTSIFITQGGVTASSGTFTATGDNQYSIETSSGIKVNAGNILSPNIILVDATTSRLHLPKLTSTEFQTLVPSDVGDLYYNTTKKIICVSTGTVNAGSFARMDGTSSCW